MKDKIYSKIKAWILDYRAVIVTVDIIHETKDKYHVVGADGKKKTIEKECVYLRYCDALNAQIARLSWHQSWHKHQERKYQQMLDELHGV